MRDRVSESVCAIGRLPPGWSGCRNGYHSGAARSRRGRCSRLPSSGELTAPRRARGGASGRPRGVRCQRGGDLATAFRDRDRPPCAGRQDGVSVAALAAERECVTGRGGVARRRLRCHEPPLGANRARTGPAPHCAAATATVRQLALFGGEITAGLVEVRRVVGDPGRRRGRLPARDRGARRHGQPVDAFANARVDLGDWGYAVLSSRPWYRRMPKGRHPRLRDRPARVPHRRPRRPARRIRDSDRLRGGRRADAGSKPPPEPSPARAGRAGDGAAPAAEPARNAGGSPERSSSVDPPGADPEPPGAEPDRRRPSSSTRPPGVQPQITGQGYVFPVWGPASFSDDFGAPRATTGWHHGNDIFAPLGAPILAVSDGTLFLVGWNDVGGHRLWLRDGQGNEYYYAHLSAYSPLAVNGARVEAGDVLGFVGATGDAAGTPYHLHFEIHPTALLGLGYDGVVNPYAYLARLERPARLEPGRSPGATRRSASPRRHPRRPGHRERQRPRPGSRPAGLRGTALPRSDGRLHASHAPALVGRITGLRHLTPTRTQSGRNASVPTSTAVAPPSTGSTAPVRNDDSREARKRQTAAISSGSAGRPSG